MPRGDHRPDDLLSFSASDVSAIVCTLNSQASIERCLSSLIDAHVGELIVVDGGSTDETIEIARQYADSVVFDEGVGLGAARNIGIAASSMPLILNMGSDNVMPPGQLDRMIASLISTAVHGVSAQTRIDGKGFIADGLNAWRTGRFSPGEVEVIGTPTLFLGDVLRQHPYDSKRRFSDDSELCERWRAEFNARFAISDAFVWEVGKASWSEVVTRCRMYGESDAEVFRQGSRQGWAVGRKLESLSHPLRADFLQPLGELDHTTAIRNAPFLAAFTGLRYLSWAHTALAK